MREFRTKAHTVIKFKKEEEKKKFDFIFFLHYRHSELSPFANVTLLFLKANSCNFRSQSPIPGSFISAHSSGGAANNAT